MSKKRLGLGAWGDRERIEDFGLGATGDGARRRRPTTDKNCRSDMVFFLCCAMKFGFSRNCWSNIPKYVLFIFQTLLFVYMRRAGGLEPPWLPPLLDCHF